MSIKLKIIIVVTLISGLLLSSCASKPSKKMADHSDSPTYYLYFSDTMEKFFTSGTVISSNEKTQVIKKTKGLELGGLVLNKSDVYFSDINNSFQFDSKTGKTTKTKRKFEEYTGQYFSNLKGQPLAVYNSGYSSGADGEAAYTTRFYWDEDILEINEFMRRMGEHNNTVFSIGEIDGEKDYIVSQYVEHNGKLERTKLGTIPIVEDDYFAGDILFFDNALYILYEQSDKINLLKYDIKSAKHSLIDLSTNMIVDDIPFGNANYTTIKDGKFIFISDASQLYQYDLRKEKMLPSHRLNIDFPSHFIIDWNAKDIATIASLTKQSDIIISNLDLNSFKVDKVKEIKTSFLVKNEVLYDFKVMQKN